MTSPFQLPDSCRHEFPYQCSRTLKGISASMKAAADPDSRTLRAVLARRRKPSSAASPADKRSIRKGYRSREELDDSYGPNSTVSWPYENPITTPLLQAIRSQLLQNVDVLLEAGAEPSGIDMESLENYQAFFLRFRPSFPPYVHTEGDIAYRRTLLECMELPQTAPITDLEIEQRIYAMAPFWRFPETTSLNFSAGGDEMHALVAAARQPSTEIFDRLLKAGADASFWMSEKQSIQTDSPTQSSLAVTTPLHAAIESGNIPMIHHVLSSGFEANVVPASTPHCVLTPLMSTFLTPHDQNDAATSVFPVTGKPSPPRPLNSSSPAPTDLPSTFNLAAYNALLSYSSTSHAVTSSILSIHPFHLAVAHVSLPLLQYVLHTISLPLSHPSPTALGHNLLHIACLPPSVHHMNTRSLAISYSIHDTRDLRRPQMRRQSPPCPHIHHFYSSTRPFSARHCEQCHHQPHNHSFFPAQTELLAFLLSQLPRSALTHQDVYGNTPLHYLVAHRVLNDAALELFRSVTVSDDMRKDAHQEERNEPSKKEAEDPFTTMRNRWGYSAQDLLEDAAKAAAEAEAEAETGTSDTVMYVQRPENETKARELTRRLDTWWDERLEQRRHQEYEKVQQELYKGSAEAAAAASRGRGGGRGRDRGRGRGRGRGSLIPVSPFCARPTGSQHLVVDLPHRPTKRPPPNETPDSLELYEYYLKVRETRGIDR